MYVGAHVHVCLCVFVLDMWVWVRAPFSFLHNCTLTLLFWGLPRWHIASKGLVSKGHYEFFSVLRWHRDHEESSSIPIEHINEISLLLEWISLIVRRALSLQFHHHGACGHREHWVGRPCVTRREPSTYVQKMTGFTFQQTYSICGLSLQTYISQKSEVSVDVLLARQQGG